MFRINRVVWGALILLSSFFLLTEHSYGINSVFQGSLSKYTGEQIQFVANTAKIVVSTDGPNNIQRLRSYNPNIEILYYFNIKGVHTWDPLWSEVQSGNLLWLDSAGKPVKNTTYDWYVVDIRSSDWANLIVEFLRDKMTYYDGVMLDESRILWEAGLTSVPFGYMKSEYYNALDSLFKKINISFPDKKIIMNGYQRWSGEEFNGTHLLQHTDGLSFEGFSYRLNGEYIGKEALKTSMEHFSTSVDIYGRQAVFVDFSEKANYQRRLFSLANYLLVAHDNSYYYFIGIDIASRLQKWPEYELNIGFPNGKYYETQKGILKRSYSSETQVFSNPTEAAITLDLSNRPMERLELSGGGNWSDSGSLSWKPTSRFVEMPPKTGLIVRLANPLLPGVLLTLPGVLLILLDD